MRQRCSNFKQAEVELLINLIESGKHIIESKRTDRVSNNLKDSVWEEVTKKFNKVAGSSRTSNQLKMKWDSLKKFTRTELTNMKMDPMASGEGPGKLTPSGEKVMRIVGLSSINERKLSLLLEKQKGYPVKHSPPSSTLNFSNEKSLESPVAVATPNLKISPRRNTTNSTQSETKHVDSNAARKSAAKRPLLVKPTKLTPEDEKNFKSISGKKLELLNLQLHLLKREYDSREKRNDEKHQLEIEILKTDLLVKKKQLNQ